MLDQGENVGASIFFVIVQTSDALYHLETELDGDSDLQLNSASLSPHPNFCFSFFLNMHKIVIYFSDSQPIWPHWLDEWHKAGLQAGSYTWGYPMSLILPGVDPQV